MKSLLVWHSRQLNVSYENDSHSSQEMIDFDLYLALSKSRDYK